MIRMQTVFVVCAVAGTTQAQTSVTEAASLESVLNGSPALPFDFNSDLGLRSEDPTGWGQDVVLRTDFIPAPGAAVPLLGAAMLGSRRRRR